MVRSGHHTVTAEGPHRHAEGDVMQPTEKGRTTAAGGRKPTPGHRGTPRRTATRGRRALRREVAGTVPLLTDRDDFAAMRRYTSFPFDDHTRYLQAMRRLLNALAAEHLHVGVTRFDPAAYAGYCAATGLEPDSPASRVRYTADVAAPRLTVRYRGQPVEHLATELALQSAHQADRERAEDLLATAAARSPSGPGGTAFERASQAVLALVESAGPGRHHLVASVPVDGTALTGVLHLETDADGIVRLAEADVLAFCTILAAGIATGSPGGVVLRTCAPPGDGTPDRIRGWTLRDGWLHPLTEAEVFNAHCTDAATGEPVPPEPGLTFAPGTHLPPPGAPPR